MGSNRHGREGHAPSMHSGAQGADVRELKAAIDAGHVAPAYQPKVCCRTGKVDSFEALARWRRGNSTVSPETFIPLAEQHDLIHPLTVLITDSALHWVSRLHRDDPVNICINVSTAVIEGRSFLEHLVDTCRQNEVAADRVVLELTESRALANIGLALEFVTRARLKGFHLAIDDVGTGYASHRRLAQLPFTDMKLDKLFVLGMMSSVKSRAMVENLVNMGHRLGLRVIAEGVEDQAALDILLDFGCDVVQGYFIARPMDPEAATTWFHDFHAARDAWNRRHPPLPDRPAH
ncbi:MAG TPA: EAL domain-containing protein [Gammaproteobacteria bacterium]